MKRETEAIHMSLEDMLESMDEKQKSESFMDGRIEELEETEKKLLLLIEDHQEQLFLIDSSMKGLGMPMVWIQQTDIIKEKIGHHMTACGITAITETGVTVNYDCHEVLKVVDTREEELDKTVLEVYSPGFIYKGKVWKKAKIAAYRLEERGNHGDNYRN